MGVAIAVCSGVGADESLQALRTTAMARTVRTESQWMRRDDTVISVDSPHVVLESSEAKPVAAYASVSALVVCPTVSTLSSVRIVAIQATRSYLPQLGKVTPPLYRTRINLLSTFDVFAVMSYQLWPKMVELPRLAQFQPVNEGGSMGSSAAQTRWRIGAGRRPETGDRDPAEPPLRTE